MRSLWILLFGVSMCCLVGCEPNKSTINPNPGPGEALTDERSDIEPNPDYSEGGEGDIRYPYE